MSKLILIGLILIVAGLACNFIVISANHGMPVPYWDYMAKPDRFHTPMMEGTKFMVLADVMGIQKANWGTFWSVGDLMVWFGILISGAGIYGKVRKKIRKYHEVKEVSFN
jgi:hypothetical protein